MLIDLRCAHDAVLASHATMGQLLAAHVPDRVALAAARMRFGRAHAERLRLLATRVYPALERANAGHPSAIRALREGDQALVARLTLHISTWAADRMITHWAQFCEAAVPLRAAIWSGIEQERRVLYPLLGRMARGSAAFSSSAAIRS